MTREEARKAAEVMLAYADGKIIEFCKRQSQIWLEINEPIFNWGENIYRIKQESTYYPFKNKEECWAEMQKHQPFGWITNEGEKFINIFNVDNIGVDFIDDGDLCSLDYKTAIKGLTFADGTPFGIKEE